VIVADLKQLAEPITKLRPLPGNPRVGDVDAIVASLGEFGQRKPVVATRDGVVIAGNHTLAAAQRLGWSQLAVVWVDDDERTASAFALADNRTGDLGIYNDRALADLIATVADDPALLLATSHTAEDLASLLALLDAPSYLDGLDDDALVTAAAEAVWPRIAAQVPPAVFARWAAVPGEDDAQRIEAVLAAWEAA
jgi:hypothetical protein